MTTAQSAEKSAAVREGAHEYFPDRHSSPRRMPNPMTTAQSAEKSAAVREGAHEDVTWKPEASSADPVVAEPMRSMDDHYEDETMDEKGDPPPAVTVPAQSAEESAAALEGAHDDVTRKLEASSADPVVAEPMLYRPFAQSEARMEAARKQREETTSVRDHFTGGTDDPFVQQWMLDLPFGARFPGEPDLPHDPTVTAYIRVLRD